MNSRSTWTLLCLAAGLFAFIWFVERPFRESRNQPPETRLLPGLDVSAVTNIQIGPAGQLEIKLEKHENGWEVVRPFIYPADAIRIQSLLDNLAKLTTQGHITSQELADKPKANEEFGFKSPQFSIILQEGDVTRHLLVGSRTVMGDQLFLQLVGGDGFHLVTAELLKLLPPGADAWRERTLLSEAANQADAFEVRAGGKGFRLEINPTNNLWRMSKPLDSRVDNVKLQKFFTDLASLEVVAFVPDRPELDFETLFGLPNTSGQNAELELVFLRGTNVVAGIQAGSVLTNYPSLIFVRRLVQNVVCLVPKEPLDAWRMPSSDIRDRHLVQLSTNNISKIEVRGADSLTLEKQADAQWLATQPDRFVADLDMVRDMLVVLTQVEVEFANDVVTDFAPFGLTAPLLEYRISGPITNFVTQAEEIKTEQLSFGTNAVGKVFVRRNNESRVYSISPAEFELLPSVSWQMRDRRIWNFAVTNVVSVTIEQKGRTRKIVHAGPNEWSLAPGSEGVINPFSLEEAVHRIGELKAVFWTARGNEDRFGFKAADHRVSFEVKKDGKTETRTIEFGDYSPFYHPYARVSLDGQIQVFEFPLPLFMEFVRRDLSIFPPPLPSPK